MSAAIKITRDDFDAAGLRRQAARTRNSDIARRRLALALIAEGKSRAEHDDRRNAVKACRPPPTAFGKRCVNTVAAALT